MILELIIILAALCLLAATILIKIEADISKQSNKDLFKNMQDCEILKELENGNKKD